MIEIEVVGIEKVEAFMRRMPLVTKRAARGAINDTLTHTRAGASKRIRSEFNILARDLKKQMVIKRATNAHLEGSVRIKGEPVPLLRFAARQTRKGVTAKIKKKGKRTLIRSAFMQTMDSGHKGAFKRLGRKRLPIAERKVISAPSMFRQHLDELEDDSLSFLDRRFKARMEYELSK